MLADGALRHAESMSDLFSSLSAAEHFRDLACVGYYNGNAGLAQGFAEAEEAIFSVWQSRARSNERLLLAGHPSSIAGHQGTVERGHGHLRDISIPALEGSQWLLRGGCLTTAWQGGDLRRRAAVRHGLTPSQYAKRPSEREAELGFKDVGTANPAAAIAAPV
jgi:hypothetical protein